MAIETSSVGVADRRAAPRRSLSSRRTWCDRAGHRIRARPGRPRHGHRRRRWPARRAHGALARRQRRARRDRRHRRRARHGLRAWWLGGQRGSFARARATSRPAGLDPTQAMAARLFDGFGPAGSTTTFVADRAACWWSRRLRGAWSTARRPLRTCSSRSDAPRPGPTRRWSSHTAGRAEARLPSRPVDRSFLRGQARASSSR